MLLSCLTWPFTSVLMSTSDASRLVSIQGPSGQKVSVALRARPLPVVTLMISRRHVVGDRVTEDHAQRLRRRNVLARLTDDDREFTLEVHLVRGGRQDDRGTRANYGRVWLEEDHGVRGSLLRHLRDVICIILADADHLAGENRSQQTDIGERPTSGR